MCLMPLKSHLPDWNSPPAKIQENIEAPEQSHQPAAKADAKGEDGKEHMDPADPHSAPGKEGKAAKANN